MATKRPKRRLFWGLVACLGIFSLLAFAVNYPAIRLRQEKARLHSMGEKELTALVAREPGNIEAHYRLGIVYTNADRPRDASREFLAALDKEPGRADILNDLGVAYLFQQRYYEALVAFRGALTVKPDYAEAHANLGRLYIATKMPFTAVKELESASRLDPKNQGVLVDLGEAHQRTLNLNAAEKAYQKALEANPKSIPAQVGLGKVTYGLAKYTEAEKYLTSALAASPNDAEALITLGRMKFERAIDNSQLAAIQDLFERAARCDPQNPDAYYDLARIALRQGKPAEAIELFKRVLRLSPQHTGAMNQLERALRQVGRIQDADRVAAIFQRWALRSREKGRLEEHVSHAPDDWEARFKLVNIYLDSGDLGLAQLVYKQIREKMPSDSRIPALGERIARASSGRTIP